MKPSLKGVPKAKAEKYPVGALCFSTPGQDPFSGGTGQTQRPPHTTSTDQRGISTGTTHAHMNNSQQITHSQPLSYPALTHALQLSTSAVLTTTFQAFHEHKDASSPYTPSGPSPQSHLMFTTCTKTTLQRGFATAIPCHNAITPRAPGTANPPGC